MNLSELPIRMQDKIKVLPNGCWQWIGASTRGYGVLREGDHNVYAHRETFMLNGGTIPKGYELEPP
jgi:hypothetical protein